MRHRDLVTRQWVINRLSVTPGELDDLIDDEELEVHLIDDEEYFDAEEVLRLQKAFEAEEDEGEDDDEEPVGRRSRSHR